MPYLKLGNNLKQMKRLLSDALATIAQLRGCKAAFI